MFAQFELGHLIIAATDDCEWCWKCDINLTQRVAQNDFHLFETMFGKHSSFAWMEINMEHIQLCLCLSLSLSIFNLCRNQWNNHNSIRNSSQCKLLFIFSSHVDDVLFCADIVYKIMIVVGCCFILYSFYFCPV